MWESNIDAIAETHKVYVPELWGFGYSTRELMDYSYELYVRQLLLFMDALGIKKASLAGQSLGGGIAIKFATEHPDRVNKLILVDAAGMPNKLPLMAKTINRFPALGNFMYGLNTDNIRKKGLLDYFVHDKNVLTNEYFENVTRFHKVKGTIAVMLDIMRRDFFYTLHEEIKQLASLSKDTLIVWGRHDKGNPLRLGQGMHQLLTGSKLEVIDNAKHVPNSEQPEQFNQIATRFLNA
jgi:pimeloyl-ACP methyl ester carboxylesterase